MRKINFYLALIGFPLLLLECICRLSLPMLGFGQPAISEYKSAREKLDAAAGFRAYRPQAHPLFGVTDIDPKWFWRSHGFHNPEIDLPHTRKSDEFVIAIFGGSVAEGFSNYLNDQRKQIQMKIWEAVPMLRGRQILFLNFALGAFKQPQQFAIYSYFFDSFDLSINLDGLNEVMYNTIEFPVEYPIFTKNLFFKSPGQNIALALAPHVRSLQLALTELPLAHPLLAKSALYKMAWEAFIPTMEYFLRNLTFSNHTKSNLPAYYGNSFSDNDLAVLGAKNWAKYSLLQGKLSQLKEIPAIFLLQPNIHLEHSKPFTETEQSYIHESTNGPFISLGYRTMVSAVPELKIRGIAVFDLTRIFANHPEEIYIDNSGHMNRHGNEIIGQQAIEIISTLLNKKRLPP